MTDRVERKRVVVWRADLNIGFGAEGWRRSGVLLCRVTIAMPSDDARPLRNGARSGCMTSVCDTYNPCMLVVSLNLDRDKIAAKHLGRVGLCDAD